MDSLGPHGFRPNSLIGTVPKISELDAKKIFASLHTDFAPLRDLLSLLYLLQS